MPLVTTIAGRYSATYTKPSGSALDLGVTVSPKGYALSFVPSWKLIQGTDAYADNVVEAVWKGFSNVFLDFVSREWKQGSIDASNPAAAYGPTGAQTFGTGVVGRRGTDLAGSVVMTATAATPAASSPATQTFTLAMIREGFNVEWMYDSDERLLPIGFRIIAVTDGSTGVKYWTAT